MKYLGIISILTLFYLIIKTLFNRSEKKRFIDNCNLHSKKQKEYLNGEFKIEKKTLMINAKGRLIEMDSHFDGILEDKQ